MDYRDLIKQIFENGRTTFSDMEAYLVRDSEKTIEYSNENLEKYALASSGGLALTVRQGDRIGAAYTENLTVEAIPELLSMAEQTLSVNEPEKAGLPDLLETDEIVNVDLSHDKPFQAASWLELGKQIATEGLSSSEEVHLIEVFIVQQTVQKLIMNTRGLSKQSTHQINLAYAEAILKRAEAMKSGRDYLFFEDISEVNPQVLAREAVKNAEANFGAKSTGSGQKTLVLDRRVMASWLNAFEPSFSGENVNFGMSSIQDKLGEEIASAVVNLVSDPLAELSSAKRYFDDEGVSTSYLPLIDKGVLKDFLYDQTSAKQAQVASSGNAQRSYKGPSKPRAFNLTLLPGDLSREALFEQAGDGIYITGLQGLHSGLSTISGDFSVPASGFLIENGQLSRPLNQIVIAGNFVDLLRKIEAVGSDLELEMSGCIAPSVLVRDVSVSGENEN